MSQMQELIESCGTRPWMEYGASRGFDPGRSISVTQAMRKQDDAERAARERGGVTPGWSAFRKTLTADNLRTVKLRPATALRQADVLKFVPLRASDPRVPRVRRERVCEAEGCSKVLARQSLGNLCIHYFVRPLRDGAPRVRFCAVQGCDRKLHHQTRGHFCRNHRQSVAAPVPQIGGK
jgi:hypothetical protein